MTGAGADCLVGVGVNVFKPALRSASLSGVIEVLTLPDIEFLTASMTDCDDFVGVGAGAAFGVAFGVDVVFGADVVLTGVVDVFPPLPPIFTVAGFELAPNLTMVLFLLLSHELIQSFLYFPGFFLNFLCIGIHMNQYNNCSSIIYLYGVEVNMQIKVNCGPIEVDVDSPLLKVPGGDDHARRRNDDDRD